ncbi:hypothetical protein V8C86DRAFT_2565548 [Haematococcus lacustris]
MAVIQLGRLVLKSEAVAVVADLACVVQTWHAAGCGALAPGCSASGRRCLTNASAGTAARGLLTQQCKAKLQCQITTRTVGAIVEVVGLWYRCHTTVPTS